MQSVSPKKKSRPATAVKGSPEKVSMTMTITTPIADDIARREGLTDANVELQHLRTIVQEMRRERDVTESIQKDNAMLREQLRRAEEVRVEQLEHINKLDQVRIEQQTHINVLV